MGEGNKGNQERNIMIMFLSDFKFEEMPKEYQDKVNGTVVDGKTVDGSMVKALLSKFKCEYVLHDGRKDDIKCSHTNDAPIRDVVKYLWEARKDTLDKIFYFCTSMLQTGSVWLWDEGELHWYETPEMLFKTRIRKICSPYLDDTELVAIPFDTTSKTPIQECINAVVDLEDEITANIPLEDMEHCHLFADITGGIRTANMVMTAVRQLLQYNRIHLDLVLYSDGHVVSDVRDIDNLYKLVAGLEAFTQYGRSDTIEDYFGFHFLTDDGKENKPKNKLEKLLVAMHHFADAMSLCWPDHIINALKELIKALNYKDSEGCDNPEVRDEPEDSDNPKERLLVQLLPTIRDKYKSLYYEKDEQTIEIKRPAVIKWCAENNLIQPALTLITEWLPDFMAEYGAVYTDDPAILKYCTSKGMKKDGDTTGYKCFFRDFCVNSPAKSKEEINQGTKQKKTALQRIMEISARIKLADMLEAKGDCVDVDKPFPIFEPAFPARLSRFLRSIPQRLPVGTPSPTSDEEERLFQIFFENLVEATEHPPATSSRAGKPRNQITEEDIYNRLKSKMDVSDSQFQSSIVGQLGGRKPCQYPYRAMNEHISNDDETYQKAEKISMEMLRSGMMKTVFCKPSGRPDFERAVDLIRQYTYIRVNIRNTSLHAADTTETKKDVPESFVDVKRALDKCLEAMHDLINDERAIAHKAKNVWADAPKKEEASK